MTQEQAVRELREVHLLDDPEAAHGQADTILCSLLLSMGAEEVVTEWLKVKRWYA